MNGSFVEWVSRKISFGVKCLASLLKRNPQALVGQPTSVFTPEQSAEIQGNLHLSHGGLATLNSMFIQFGSAARVASKEKIKQHLSVDRVAVSYRDVVLESSTDTVNALVYQANSFDVLARDLDKNHRQGIIHQWAFTCNEGRQESVSIVLGQDGGGLSEKHTQHVVNSTIPCSPKVQSIIGSAERLRHDDPRKPAGSWNNFAEVLRNVEGVHELNSSVVVEINGRHVVIPRHTVPSGDTWECVTTDAAGKDDFLGSAFGRLSPAENRAARAALAPHSAQFLRCENDVLGIVAGGISFPFRQPVLVSELALCLPVIREIDVYLCADLAALTVMMGMPNQSGLVCIYCRGDAEDFKKCARGLQRLRPRTAETQAEDLEEFLRDHLLKRKHVNGVSCPPIYQLDFSRILPPYLHIILGLVNDEMRYIYKYLLMLDQVDLALLDRIIALQEELDDAEIELARAIEKAREVLGVAHEALRALGDVKCRSAGRIGVPRQVGGCMCSRSGTGPTDRVCERGFRSGVDNRDCALCQIRS